MLQAEGRETLLQAYRNTTSSELGDIPQAIAKLIARHKDGSKSGPHTAAYKNCYCYTAPPSLTAALINALVAPTELSATPSDFILNVKHYSAPFAEDAEFGAHPDTYFFHLAGQQLLSPRILRC